MVPYIQIGRFVIESYKLFINLGTLLGAFAMYLVLDKKCLVEKFRWKIVVIVMAIMGLSVPFAKFIKGVFRNGDGNATHFLGRVLVTAILMEIVFFFFWKAKECELQARNSVVLYLAIQHFFNRLSCFMNGCCNGKIIEAWNKRFPSQIVEMCCMAVIIALILYCIKKEKTFYYAFYIAFSVVIFISEFLIEDTRTNAVATSPITGVQLGAIILFVFSSACLIIKIRHGDRSRG